MYAFTTLAFALLAGQAALASTLSPQTVRELVRRQTVINPDDVPEACKSKCDPVVSSITKCAAAPETEADPSCVCAPEISKGAGTCFQCVLDADPSAEAQKQAQTSYDALVTICKALSLDFPAMSLTLAAGGKPTTTDSTTDSPGTGPTTTPKDNNTATTKPPGSTPPKPNETSSSDKPEQTDNQPDAGARVVASSASLLGAIAVVAALV